MVETGRRDPTEKVVIRNIIHPVFARYILFLALRSSPSFPAWGEHLCLIAPLCHDAAPPTGP